MIDSGIEVFHFLSVGFILFLIGLFGIFISKNLVKILLSTVIIVNSICINFAAISYFSDGIKQEGVTFSIFVTVISLIYIIIFTSLIINISNSNKKDKSNLEE